MTTTRPQSTAAHYLRRDEFDYWRFGAHSVHSAQRAETLEAVVQACVSGEFEPKTYKIFSIFPTLSVTLFKAGPYWYAMAQQFEPRAAGLTRWRACYFRTRWRRYAEPFGAGLAPALADRIVSWFIRREAGQITEEDHVACERLQTEARAQRSPARLSAHEERVGWFHDAWTAAMTPRADAP